MNFDNLNKWLALLGNFGVIAGIVFLGIEIQQNTNMMKAQTRDSLTEKNLMVFSASAESAYAADVLYRGSIGEITPDTMPEWVTFTFQVQGMFRVSENESYQYDRGLFDEAEYQARKNTWRRNLSRVGFRAVWERYREEYSESFRDEMDQLAKELDAN
ncbi:MAG: hypothetical protein JKY86_06425 [Gammaproteobacteria bacterium]|nr:hypothetical protein [Gammaproteobacteria bacterium]